MSGNSLNHNMVDHRTPPVTRIAEDLEKPSLDDRSYRVIKLSNQLEVLLVHDPETDKASAAMDVNVGNYSDPDDLPGLSHSLEHMLFMGTKKYPVENEYSQYLSKNSGTSNAYTAATSTNYYFEVGAKTGEGQETSPLYGALDRFAQFFIEPLFLTSTLDRELRAVDSEHKKNLQNDQWRLHQLDKALANPRHPYCHFSTGSLETLKIEPEKRGVDIRQAFLDHHEKYYSANRMKLVILGREPLDTLEKWAVEFFSDVKDKNLPQNRWEDEVPYLPEHLQTQVFAKPVMDSRSLELTFPYLDEETLFESQPSRYISHLIGHEGPGSIMSYIKSKGWANGLSSGAYSVCPGSPGLFSIQIRLTEEGLKNYQEIVKVVFQYTSMLKEAPPQEWIFEENKMLAEIDFKFKQKSPASKFTSHTSAVMQLPLPREWLLSGDSRLRKFEPELIKKGLSYLRPDNFKMVIVSQTYPGKWDKKEKWYGTDYASSKIPEDFMQEITTASKAGNADRFSELHLPHRNQFIPQNLEVEKKDIPEEERALAPKLIRNDEFAQTWFKKDDTFWVPKANLFIVLRNPLPGATAENAVKARVYAELVKDALEEYAYDAELAGLNYDVASYSGGLDIEIAGYNDKLSVLLEKVLTTMRDLVVRTDRFAIVKERLMRGMKNWDLQQPYHQVGDFTRWLNSERGFVNDQLLAELPAITAADIQSYYPQLLRQASIQALVHGNVYKEDALKLTDLIESTLKARSLPKTQWPVLRSLAFPRGSSFVFNRTLRDPANVNHCIEYLLYFGEKSDRELRAKTLLLSQMTNEPAFDQLRTKEQLGYVVFSGARVTSTTIGYRFIVQSERDPQYLESRIDNFLTTWKKTLEEMTEKEFEGQKESLINKRLEKMKNLGQESGRLWGHVTSEYLDFELVFEDAKNIKPLTKEDMITFFNEYVDPTSAARAKLAIHMHALGKSKSAIEAEAVAPVEAIEPLAEKMGEKVEAVEQILVDGVKQVEEELSKMGLIDNKKKDTLAVEVNGSQPVEIKDVRQFKASLAVTPGPIPVKDITEFEELDSKL